MLMLSHQVFSPRRFAVALLALSAACATLAATAEGAPVELSFSSFFRQPIGAHGLELGDALRAADGRSVTLVGYMVQREDAQPGRFVLAPRPVRVSEHADGEADDLPPATVQVWLDATQRDRIVAHRGGPITLTGRLEVGRREEADGHVSWVRLHLPPEATAERSESARQSGDAH